MKSILLVDDDHICNFLMGKTLERMGVAREIHTASNGQEAITLLNEYYQGSQALPDVILLDLNMPIMDGFGFLEAFKKLHQIDKDNVKIIIVTSSQDPQDISKAKLMGIDHYLSKPVLEENLRALLS
jgi:CheY-like chemotaxis protein